MRKLIIIVTTISLGCYSLAGFFSTASCDINSIGDVGDAVATVDVSNYTFEEMPACTTDNSFEYSEGNEVCSVSDVTFTPNKIRLFVKFNYLSKPLKDAGLTFKVGCNTVVTTISYVFSTFSYEVLLPRKSAQAFKMIGFTGTPCNVSLGELKEFGFPVEKKGYNTLKYFGFHKIFIMDKKYSVIGDVDMHGFGKEIINFGGKYYAEVVL